MTTALLPLFVYMVFHTAVPPTSNTNNKQLVWYSTNVKDSFDIKIILPSKYDKNKKYNTVYFLDANIKSGTKLIALLKEKENQLLTSNTIFVGIGHKGVFEVQRQRDFLPPKMKDDKPQKSTDKNYGHADTYYTFLEKEIIPYIEKEYSVTTHRSIIGHSFGGLFAHYCLLRKERLFTNYFALSPSLWVDYSNIFKYETLYYKNNKSLSAYLYMANGSLEFLNYVLPTNRRMNALLKQRKYTHLKYEYIEKQWANHNSHVALTLQEVLNKLKKK
jgi:predicted alpha/beta superfamily hydrolase